TKAAALDYAQRGIRVNAVGPGPIETPLLAKGAGGDPHVYASVVPMGRIGQPTEVASAVVWLCSDEASFVTGITMPIDGGFVAQWRARGESLHDEGEGARADVGFPGIEPLSQCGEHLGMLVRDVVALADVGLEVEQELMPDDVVRAVDDELPLAVPERLLLAL